MVKNLPANAGDVDSILELGRSPEGHGNLLQYFCLENPMDRGAWRATVQSRKEADISEDLACKLVKSDLLHLKLESGFAI